MSLAHNSSDCEVWRLAQAQQMLLITASRNMVGEESLEQTIREESQVSSLPVITISSVNRMLEAP
jgi:hypothetical protein